MKQILEADVSFASSPVVEYTSCFQMFSVSRTPVQTSDPHCPNLCYPVTSVIQCHHIPAYLHPLAPSHSSMGSSVGFTSTESPRTSSCKHQKVPACVPCISWTFLCTRLTRGFVLHSQFRRICQGPLFNALPENASRSRRTSLWQFLLSFLCSI